MQGFAFDAFISYRRSDGSRAANWLRRTLQAYRLPRPLRRDASPLRIFLDTAYERASEDFYERNIGPALQASRYLIVIATPESLRPRADGSANWVEREIADFRRMPQGRNVLVVRTRDAPDAPLPGGLLRDFPNLGFVNLAGLSYWRFVAWKRWAGLHDELLKVVAPLYDVRAEQMPLLRAEERRRARQRFAGIGVVAVTLIVLMVMLAVQFRAATERGEQARARDLTLEANRLREAQPVLAAMLARKAVALEDSREAREALFQALARTHAWEQAVLGGASATEARWSPDGRYVLTLRSAQWHAPPLEDLLVARVWDANGKRVAVLRGPDPALIHDAAWSPDGTRIATAHEGDRVRLWNVHGRLLASLSIRTAMEGTTVSWSPDGAHLLVTSRDNRAGIWTLDGKLLRNFAVSPTHQVAAWSPDGMHVLVTDGWDVKIWGLNGAAPDSFAAGAELTTAAWTPDGRWVLAASADGHVEFWDVARKRKDPALAFTVTDQIRRFGWSPGGGRLLTVGLGSTDLRDARGKVLANLAGEFIDGVWSRDGRRILTIGSSGGAAVWDSLGHQVAMIDRHFDRGSWSPDGRHLAAIGGDTARIWVLEDCGPAVLRGNLRGAWSPDGSRVATVSSDGTASVWDLAGNRLASIADLPEDEEDVRWTPDGRRIVFSSFDGRGQVWEKAVPRAAGLRHGGFRPVPSHDGRLLLDQGPGGYLAVRDVAGHVVGVLAADTALASAAWSPDNTRLLTVSRTGRMTMWEGRTNRFERDSVTLADWSPDGRQFVTVVNRTTATIHALDGRAVATLQRTPNAIDHLVWSPDGRHLFTYEGVNYTGSLWTREGRQLATVQGAFMYAAWDPASTRVLTHTMGDEATVWDLGGHAAAVLRGHNSRIAQAAWSPDGTRVLTVSYDRTARIWDLASGAVNVLEGHGDIVYGGAWSPDGRCVLTVAFDGTARIWPAVPLLQYADTRVRQTFAEDERRAYLERR